MAAKKLEINSIKKELKYKNSYSANNKNFEKIVSLLTEEGYMLVSSNKYQTVFRSPKKFNWTAFILLTLFLNIFGLIGYLIYYRIKDTGKQVILNKSSN